MIDIDILQNNYYQNCIDVPYKLGNNIYIYIKPILVKNYIIYEWAKDILEIDKNEINDIEIIKMSYLEFIFEKFINNINKDIKKEYNDKFLWLIKLCLNEEYVTIVRDKNNKLKLIILDDKNEIKFIITPKQFDDIKKIILSQNNPNYDDRYVSPDVKEMMEEYYKVKYKDSSYPSLEEQKAFVSSKIGKTFKELGELTYREFILIYDSCLNSELYIAQKIIQASQKYEVKGDIKHPLYEPKVDPYEELFKDTNVLNNKGIMGVEQLNNINIQ